MYTTRIAIYRDGRTVAYVVNEKTGRTVMAYDADTFGPAAPDDAAQHARALNARAAKQAEARHGAL